MQRLHKVALGVAAALLVHLALFFLLAPRLDGLVAESGTGASEAGSSVIVNAEPQEAIDSDKTLEVGWPGADEEDQVQPEPSLEPPPAAKPKRRVEPEPRPRPRRRDPADNDISGSAESIGATPVANAEASYAQRVRQHLGRFAGALPPGANGEARVQFVVQPDGRVTDVQLVKRSGHNALDTMALSLPQQAQPLPLPGLQPQRLEVPLQAVSAAP